MYYNFIFFLILISNIIGEIKGNEPLGVVFTKYLNNSIKAELTFYSEKKLIIHFLSLDCEIKIEKKDEKKTTFNIYNISNYNYEAFYISITKKHEAPVLIKPLIYSPIELSQNRNYTLIVNSIDNEDKKNPELNITKNEPIFLYFNNELRKVNLLYEFKNSSIEHPIIISFFIKEKMKFKIKISDNQKTIIERNINYKENILIKPEFETANYNISIIQEETIINSTMIVKIIQDNLSPNYLQKNQLNLGFFPIQIDYYYYYMEIFKGEEGEIMLFNKRQSGILISRIIEKNNNIIPKLDEFPKYNENDLLSNKNLEFNIYNQKLNFNCSKTVNCTKGCFLLITYYSNFSKSLEINGTEFSILSRIWNEEEFDSQIINIPINEYIFSSFEEMALNIHYYTVFIPNKTKEIYIEIHGNNVLGYYKKGIAKINTENAERISSNTKKLFEECQGKMIIKLNSKDIGLNSFQGEYISFAFVKGPKDIHSYYYFRILKQNPENNYIVYPLDTNKENFCEKNNNKCYFLLKNEYNDLSNKIFIYGYGENEIFYKVFYINENDYYSGNLSITNLTEVKEIESFNGHLSLDLKTNEHFFLIDIESNSIEIKYLTIISEFYSQPNFSSINLYSYQLYHLSENKLQQFLLYQNPLNEYRILINNTEGEGNICFNKICDNNNYFIHLEKQKIYSFSISNKKDFFITANNDLIYNIKIIYDISNKAIKELNYQHNFEEIDLNKEVFPFIYFIKDVKYNGININFIFKFDNNDNRYNNFIIKGYGLDYSEISLIKDKNDIKKISFTNEIKGKYDNITNSGSIELNNELIKTKYKEEYNYTDDKYFMIIIENFNTFNFENFKNNIYVFSKDEKNILLPINKYIRNSFNLIENKKIFQKYFFEKEKITTNNRFILEFSSNYESIELEFNNLTNWNIIKIIGGFKQYHLSINSNNSIDYYCNMVINPKSESNLENPLKEVNIIIKYYNEENKINADYIYNKNFTLEKINNTQKYSNKKLIIKNNNEINNFINDFNYIYCFRLIKKTNILNNEVLNTIATISSNLFYINATNSSEPNKEIVFYLNNLENNEEYIASLFIKVENSRNEEEEAYYSMIYEFNTNLEKEQNDNNSINNWWIVLIFIIIFIITLFIFIIIYRKLRLKDKNLEDKVDAISLSSVINDNLVNLETDKAKGNEDYENTFI